MRRASAVVVVMGVVMGVLWTSSLRAEERVVQPPLLLIPGKGAGQGCELVLRMYYNHASTEQEMYLVTDTHDTDPNSRYRNGVCIKAEGDVIRLPMAMTMWSNDISAHDGSGAFADGQLCQRDTVEQLTPNDAWGTCRWSNVYRNRYPFTVEIEGSEAMQDLVSSLRIYRNGELAYAWSASPELYPVRQLFVPGRQLSRSRTPHDAEFDLRIVPADDRIVTPEQARRVARQASLDAVPPTEARPATESPPAPPAPTDAAPPVETESKAPPLEANPTQQEQTAQKPRLPRRDLLVWNEKARGLLQTALPEKLTRASTMDDSCGVPEQNKPIKAMSLAADDIVKVLRARTGKSLVSCTRLEDELDSMIADADDAIRELQLDPNGTCFADSARNLVGLLRQLRDPISSLCALQHEDTPMRDRVLLASLALSQQLEARTSATDARVPSPPLVEGERSLDMRYGDNVQGYLLAGWNAVPMKITEDVGFDLRPTVVLPVVDLGGMRLAWGPSRLSEFRLAGGGMVFQEKDGGKEALRVGLQANLGLGTFRVGLAVVLNDAALDNRLRLVVGVDLVKLITGTNFEAL